MNKLEEITERASQLQLENDILSKACGDQITRINELENKYIEEPQFYEEAEHVISLDEKVITLQKQLGIAKRYLITIGNIARLKDNPFLSEINSHVNDALDHLNNDNESA